MLLLPKSNVAPWQRRRMAAHGNPAEAQPDGLNFRDGQPLAAVAESSDHHHAERFAPRDHLRLAQRREAFQATLGQAAHRPEIARRAEGPAAQGQVAKPGQMAFPVVIWRLRRPGRDVQPARVNQLRACACVHCPGGSSTASTALAVVVPLRRLHETPGFSRAYPRRWTQWSGVELAVAANAATPAGKRNVRRSRDLLMVSFQSEGLSFNSPIRKVPAHGAV